MDLISTKNIDQRDLLAKLMAEENICVEHKNIGTATFDSMNRILTLPNWSMDEEDFYLMLMAHEIGHALFTPSINLDKIFPSEGDRMKDIFNVVEDFRVDTLIKQRFPGIQSRYRTAYKSLIGKGMFDVDGKEDISQFNFLDRLNIHTKAGFYKSKPVPFNKEESLIVRDVDKVRNIRECIRVCKRILEYLKNEEQQREEPKAGDGEDSNEENQEGDNNQKDDQQQSDSDGEGEDSTEDQQREKGEQGDSESDEDSGGNESDTEEEDQESNDGSTQGSLEEQQTDEDPFSSETQRKLDDYINNYERDKDIVKDYLDLRKLNPYDFIIKHQSLHDYLSKCRQIKRNENKIQKNLSKFRSFNKPIVDHMIMDFERKKIGR